jgi:hypothetical protein
MSPHRKIKLQTGTSNLLFVEEQDNTIEEAGQEAKCTVVAGTWTSN